MPADIIGIGVALPRRILTNADLERMVDTSDKWIVTRTGISERRIAEDDVQVSDLAAEAGRRALDDAGLKVGEIDLILVATGSPEMIWPSTACLAQAKLGAEGCPAFDLQAACTGFTYGLAIADSLIDSGAYRNILLIGAEIMSRFVNWKDRNTCVLFGDGAGAVVLGPAGPGYGFLAHYLAADGAGAGMLGIPAGGSAQVCGSEVVAEDLQTIKMNGNEVFRFAVRTVPESIEAVLGKAAVSIEAVDFFVLHQANRRIIEAVGERLGVPKERMVCNISKYGNTSTASIPLVLEEMQKAGSIAKGTLIVTAAFGAGLTWGANVIRCGRLDRG